MRLWSLHPEYLDTKGLVALWREALLARNVIEGRTRGYKNHPQLDRFRNHKNPVAAINVYLKEIYKEAESRKFKFDETRLEAASVDSCIKINGDQLDYEFVLLKKKLKIRAPGKYNELAEISPVKAHPLFEPVPGPIEPWERVKKHVINDMIRHQDNAMETI